MNQNSSFQVSQGYEILSPKPGKAYPILCEEWEFLKEKIGRISNRPNLYDMIGSLLWGGALSTLISILTGAISSNPANPDSKTVIIAWAVFAVTAFTGSISTFFGRQKHKIEEVQALEIKTQMELIEKRYSNVADDQQ